MVYYSPADSYALQYYNAQNPAKTLFQVNSDKSVSIGDSTATTPIVSVQGLVNTVLTQSRIFDKTFNNNIYSQYYKNVVSSGSYNISSSVMSFALPTSALNNIQLIFDNFSCVVSNPQSTTNICYLYLSNSQSSTYTTASNYISFDCGTSKTPTFNSTVPIVLNYQNTSGISTVYLNIQFTNVAVNKYQVNTTINGQILATQSTIMTIVPALLTDA